MADASSVGSILNEAVKESNGTVDSKHLSLESLALLTNIERLKTLEKKITTEFVELKKRQDQVSFLHKLIKMINAQTQNDEFDCGSSDDMKALLKKAKEFGVDLQENKHHYSKDERERLIENIRLTVEDYNILNDMQLQTISRLTNERYESHQLARSIMKPLHEDKVNKARAMAGK